MLVDVWQQKDIYLLSKDLFFRKKKITKKTMYFWSGEVRMRDYCIIYF